MRDPNHHQPRQRNSLRPHLIRRHALPVLAVLVGLPWLQGATVWRSVSADGVVTYSQSQPTGIPAVPVAVADPPADSSSGPETAASPTAEPQTPAPGATSDDADGPSAVASGAPKLTAEQQAALEGLRAAERARQDEARKLQLANCNRARDVLTRLTANGRIRVRDASGAERAMTEAERNARIAAAQTAVVRSCVD